MSTTIAPAAARRIALAAQGFGTPRPAGRIDVRHFRRVLRHVSLVQIDSVNVVVRAHYLPFFSRLGRYSMRALDQWLWTSGEMFEYWAHEASLVPVERRPYLRHRMLDGRRWHRVEELERSSPGYLDGVLGEVEERGPLTASDLDNPGRRTGPWWGYGRGKIALEHHFATGAVTVAGRPRFTRLYDVPERVHPSRVLEIPDVPRDVAMTELLALGAKAHGIGTTEDFADYYRLPIREARPLMRVLVERGDVAPVEVEGWNRTAYLHRDAARPRSIKSRALLAPFDPVVWHRPRAERLFGFRYRIEIYVPAEERVHGYYVLPFLLDDRLVARVDLKADRKVGRLAVRAAHHEPGVEVERVALELGDELRTLARWLELSDVSIQPVGDLAPALGVEMRRGRSS